LSRAEARPSESGGLRLHKVQPETLVVIAAGKFATACQAGDSATNPVHPWEFPLAIAAAIKVTASELVRGQRQFVTGAFVRDSEVATGAPPLLAMRKNPPASGPILRQQMSELVAQRALDFFDPETL
jgi:hypothetical protein